MSVALAALRAVVSVAGPRGERQIAMADFHRLPGDTPQRDTVLEADELITSVDLPPPRFAAHSHYLEVRERELWVRAGVSGGWPGAARRRGARRRARARWLELARRSIECALRSAGGVA